jgi:hypothetical protein
MRTTRRRGAWAALVMSWALVGGCTSGPEVPDAPSRPSVTETQQAPPEVTARHVARSLTEAEEPPVVGTTSGDVEDSSYRLRPVVVKVYSVDAYPHRTVVRFSLTSGDGEEVSLLPTSLSVDPGSWDFFRGLAVVDPVSQQRLMSFLDADGKGTMPNSIFESCSMRPKGISAETYPQTCILSALDPTAESVTFEIPHLPPIEDVPVIWHEE